VTLEWYWDGTLQDTKTVTSAGTYTSGTTPTFTGGNHNYTVKATDDLGAVDKLTTTVGIPGTLYIRNETNASELVDSPVNVTIRWFRDDTDIVISNTTSTGTVDMQGLPVSDFIVEVDPDQDYVNRTAYIPTIVGQDSVYTLNKSYTRVTTRFTLEDVSGTYSSQSILFIKRPINRSGTTKFRTVHADRFGVEGVTAELEKDVRYRVSIRSTSNETQDIGPYRATQTETVTVQPGAPVVDTFEEFGGFQVGATQTDTNLFAEYNDSFNETDSVKLYIHEYRNESNQFRPNVTYYNQQDIRAKYTFNPGENETTWRVNFIIQRNGTTYNKFALTNADPDIIPIDGIWLEVIGILVMVIFGGMFSVLNRAIAAVLIPLMGGLLFWLGFLEGATSAAGIVIALGIGMLYSVYTSGGP
jgi:hypothetical protein